MPSALTNARGISGSRSRCQQSSVTDASTGSSLTSLDSSEEDESESTKQLRLSPSAGRNERSSFTEDKETGPSFAEAQRVTGEEQADDKASFSTTAEDRSELAIVQRYSSILAREDAVAFRERSIQTRTLACSTRHQTASPRPILYRFEPDKNVAESREEHFLKREERVGGCEKLLATAEAGLHARENQSKRLEGQEVPPLPNNSVSAVATDGMGGKKRKAAAFRKPDNQEQSQDMHEAVDHATARVVEGRGSISQPGVVRTRQGRTVKRRRPWEQS